MSINATIKARAKASAERIGNPFDGSVSAETADRIVRIPLEKLQQHPANPDPQESELLEQMEWMAGGVQDEAITVRLLADPIGHYQVLGGKRRVLAASRLGWDGLDARIRTDLDDEQDAVRFIFASNARRHTDDPIRRAMGIAAQIAAGIPKDQAGAVYGITSRGGIDNVLGLLELPEPWRSRVRSREIPESAAYALKPYAAIDGVMKLLDKAYSAKNGWPSARDFQNKDKIREAIKIVLEDRTRPVDQRKHDYGYTLGNDHPRLFELTPELEQKLQIVELPGAKPGTTYRVALAVATYDAMNLPLIHKKLEAKKIGKGNSGKKAGKQAMTPAETAADLARKRKESDDRLGRYIELTWLPAFKRCMASEAVLGLPDGECWRYQILLPRLINTASTFGFSKCPLHEIEMFAGDVVDAAAYATSDDAAMLQAIVDKIDTTADPITQVEENLRYQVAMLLWPRSDAAANVAARLQVIADELPLGRVLPYMPANLIDAVCKLVDVAVPGRPGIGTTVLDGWARSGNKKNQFRELVQALFSFLTIEQLGDLAQEIAADHTSPDESFRTGADYVAGAKTKAARVTRLLEIHSATDPLALPSFLAAGQSRKKRKK